MLQPGRFSSIQWSHCGRPAGSIGIVAGENCVHLVYRHRAWGDQWQEMREIVPYTETRTCFGGRRRWFECPRCGRACRVLFGGPLPMPQVSRAPLQLAVPVGGKPNDRALAGPPDASGRLGELLEPFPPRPKHMQCRTYVRLRALDLKLLRCCSWDWRAILTV